MKFVENMGEKFKQQANKLCARDWYRLRRIMEVAFTIQEMKEKNDNTNGNDNSDSLYDKLVVAVVIRTAASATISLISTTG